MHVNAQSCFLACRYGSEAMRDERAGKKTKGGSIILTASVAGLRCASRDLLHFFTLLSWRRLGRLQVRWSRAALATDRA